MDILNLVAMGKKQLNKDPLNVTEEPVPYYDMLLNMQYYMEYCKSNDYVTPEVWLNKHKHFKQ